MYELLRLVLGILGEFASAMHDLLESLSVRLLVIFDIVFPQRDFSHVESVV